MPLTHYRFVCGRFDENNQIQIAVFINRVGKIRTSGRDSGYARVFSQVGESAVSYVRRLRMERAGRKLRMGAVDITEVARAAGYESHAAFSKAFKQQFGMSPSEFRQLGCTAATQLLTKG